MTIPDDTFGAVTPEAVNRVQTALQAWIVQTFPDAVAVVVLSALSYEIVRILGQLDAGADLNIDPDTLLDGVIEIMREQLRAHRAGRLEPGRRPM